MWHTVELSTPLPPISPVEKISWSWQRAKSRFVRAFFSGVSRGLIGGLILGLIGGLIYWLRGTISAPGYVLIIGLISTLFFGLITGLMKGLGSGLVKSEIVQRTTPNQGIRASLRNSIFIGLIVELIFGLIGGLIFGLSGMIYALISGLNCALIFGLKSGGTACIQHFTLRWTLYQKNRIPWNYAKFLDFVSERRLMKRVGGGYVFFHRMLLEHFARMNHN